MYEIIVFQAYRTVIFHSWNSNITTTSVVSYLNCLFLNWIVTVLIEFNKLK